MRDKKSGTSINPIFIAKAISMSVDGGSPEFAAQRIAVGSTTVALFDQTSFVPRWQGLPSAPRSD